MRGQSQKEPLPVQTFRWGFRCWLSDQGEGIIIMSSVSRDVAQSCVGS